MKRFNLTLQVEISIAVALAVALSYLKFFTLPQGGSITLQMVPIVVLAIRRGTKAGLLGGLLMGVIRMIINPSFFVDLVQHVLDYPVAFTMIGLSGIWVKHGKSIYDYVRNALSICLAFALRFCVHVLSGKIFFGIYAPEGVNEWWYSLTYNASYLLPELIITFIVLMLLLTRRDLFEPKS